MMNKTEILQISHLRATLPRKKAPVGSTISLVITGSVTFSQRRRRGNLTAAKGKLSRKSVKVVMFSAISQREKVKEHTPDSTIRVVSVSGTTLKRTCNCGPPFPSERFQTCPRQFAQAALAESFPSGISNPRTGNEWKEDGTYS